MSSYTKPGKTKITVKSTTKNSVKLSWSSVKGAKGYKIYVKKNGKWKHLKTVSGKSYTVNKLKRKTKYTYAVKAFLKNGTTVVWSDVQTTKTVKTK